MVPEGAWRVRAHDDHREPPADGRVRAAGTAGSTPTSTRVFAIFRALKNTAPSSPGTMSGGEQQMLAMGRAPMARPESTAARRAVDGACRADHGSTRSSRSSTTSTARGVTVGLPCRAEREAARCSSRRGALNGLGRDHDGRGRQKLLDDPKVHRLPRRVIAAGPTRPGRDPGFNPEKPVHMHHRALVGCERACPWWPLGGAGVAHQPQEQEHAEIACHDPENVQGACLRWRGSFENYAAYAPFARIKGVRLPSHRAQGAYTCASATRAWCHASCPVEAITDRCAPPEPRS